MDSSEIRRRFVSHFEAAGHHPVPSASLLLDDPTLLFVNAGMVPFKPYFLGQETPPWPRATSVQKCIRTPDIEDVGKTTRHGTFFEMCGNFSFGDYFKQRAIELAWDLVTKPQSEGGWGLEESRLYPSILDGDDEALGFWKQVTGLPDERILRLGAKENYWSMGVPGPGGPCSEILYDRGPEYGPDFDPATLGPDMPFELEDRLLEIWNLVFMQEELSAVRSKSDFDVVGPLPKKNIDTGMGLERIALLLQGRENMYEIDTMFPVIQRAEELTGRRYGTGGSAGHADDVRFRVVSDHVRSSLMLIGDGVTPGNEGRGYVLRRLLRRAVRSMRLLGTEDKVLPELMPVSRDTMGETYSELIREWDRIAAVAYAEEDAFRATLRSGTTKFVEMTSAGGGVTASDAFTLHDTYGFPIDLTLEMAAEKGLDVDQDGFRRLMQEQRDRARADARAKKGKHADAHAYRQIADTMGAPVDFTGYSETRGESTVTGIVGADGSALASASEGDEVELVVARTPFYAEGGGQLADQGVIELANGARLVVDDVQKPVNGVIVHKARVINGEVQVGDAAELLVDLERRRSISRSHTATHMVHKAFREALGETATQAGSENSPGRFRFDFSATGAVPESAMRDVEARVNDLVLADLAVEAEVMSQEDAVRSGAMALFGEKYGDRVRVVSVGDWARELCGGTHAGRSGQLGVVKLMGESSIGSGVRRVEALVGGDAYRFLAREHALVAQLSDLMKVRAEELPERVSDVLDRLRTAEKEIEQVRTDSLLASAATLVSAAEDLGGVSYVGTRLDGAGGGDVRTLALDVRGRLPGDRPAVVAVVGVADGRASVVVAANEAARSRGLSANTLVRAACAPIGGKGGGKDDVAQGGGADAAGVDDALAAVRSAVLAG